MTEENQVQEETMETAAPAAPTLGLNDLALMANVIQVTADRGAIKANEMSAVGALYSKIVAFVNSNVPQPVAEDADSINEADVETDEASEEE
jgi:hypothetical protein